MQLAKYIKKGDTEIQIRVDYNWKEDAITEILSVTVMSKVNGIPCQIVDASDLFMRYFDKDLDKLIMETNWRELYKMATA